MKNVVNFCRNAKNYQKLRRLLSMMSYFGLREWKFSNKNIDQLATLLKSQPKTNLHKESTVKMQRQNGFTGMNSMLQNSACKDASRNNTNHTVYNKSDVKASLEFDIRTIDWDEYFRHYFPGIKRYFFKDPMPEKEKCIKNDFK